MDPSDPASDRMVLQLQGGGYGPLDWSPDDRTILLAQYVSVNESYLWLVDAASGQKTLLAPQPGTASRSEEHTSELQSQSNLVCRLLLEKKKKMKYNNILRT